MKRFYFILLFSLFLLGLRPVQAQTDTEFWFAIPKLSQSHDWANRRFFFRFANMDLPSQVTIQMPANPAFVPIVLNLAPNTAGSVEVTAQILAIWTQDPAIVYNRGIQITSSELITAYFEVGTPNNPDIFSLKGRNGLGLEFFVPFQTIHYNEPLATRPYSAIYIVATEDNTEVTVTPTRPAFPGRPAGIPFTITLNKGQTYAVAPDDYNGTGNLPENRLGGTRVQANRPIAVSTSDDSVRGLPGGCYDLIGDQLVPVSIIGTEYIAMKGRLNANLNEGFYVVATQSGTQVFIDGVMLAVLNVGQTYRHAFTQQRHHVRTNHPSYVYHVAGFGCEQGGAILPPVNVCTGSTQVAFTRSKGGANGEFFMNILVRAGAQDGFIFNGQGPNTTIPASAFVAVPGTTDWLAAEFGPLNETLVPVGAASFIQNTKDVFHLGIINGGSSGGTMYGYFSDFSQVKVNANISGAGEASIRCYGDRVQLRARGGTSYEWFPPDFLTDPTSATPIATVVGSKKYTVTVSGACQMVDSASVTIILSPPVKAVFSVDESEGCAPFEIAINNHSIGVTEYSWRFGDGTVSATDASRFNYIYQNTTDDKLVRQLMLVGYNDYLCSDTMFTQITVYPEIEARIQASELSGCAPLEVDFENLSRGADHYIWLFGDGSSSTAFEPRHTFHNYSDQDTTYKVMFRAVSAFGCESLDSLLIHVKPYIKTSFDFDPPTHCNPYPLEITNTSYGSTYNYWSFDGGATFEEINDTIIYRLFENQTTSPMTVQVVLVGENASGCTDRSEGQFVVYPNIKAQFSASVLEGCNPLEVQFTNASTGAQSYQWFFDGLAGTSSDIHPWVKFENPSDQDTAFFRVKMVATSEYFCTDTTEVTIVVYPRIKADFTFDYTSHCTPQEVTFYNQSVGGLIYRWDFGDGNFSTSSAAELTNVFENNTTADLVYKVRLEIENATGCIDVLEREIRILPPIKAAFAVDGAGCHPLTLDFANTSIGASVYEWSFGDGSHSYEANPRKVFVNYSHEDNAVYTVKLLARSLYGCEDTVSYQVVVYPKPHADYVVDVEEACAPFEVVFTSTSAGALNYTWSFGDGSASSTVPAQVEHTYRNPGLDAVLYTTRLLVSNIYGCLDTLERNINALPEIKADFAISEISGCHPLEVNIKNNSAGATAADPYRWSYGDGHFSTEAAENHLHVFHNFSHTQTQGFRIGLQVQSKYGCQDSTFVNIQVYPKPSARFGASIDEGCSPLEVNFSSLSEGGLRYSWVINKHIVAGNEEDLEYIFRQQHDQGVGFFDVQLFVETEHGCLDHTNKAIQVYPDVKADFSAVLQGCHPHEVAFANTSLGAREYRWELGEGTIVNKEHPLHTYHNESFDQVKAFDVLLVSTSEYGCKAERAQQVQVFPRPFADFSLDVFEGCSPLDVAITNLSLGGTEHYWKLDAQNTISNALVFTEQFRNLEQEPQSKMLELQVVNGYGCSRISEREILVYPEVDADFTADNPSLAGCNPLRLDFQNLSERAHQYQWSFDDQTYSTHQDPLKTFYTESSSERVYQVRLFAQSVYGCHDEITKLATVYPVPVVDLFVNPHDQTYPNTKVVAENLSAPGQWNFIWDMGDGTIVPRSDNQAVEHVYQWLDNNYATRTYDVKLRAYNDYCSSEDVQRIRIHAPHPVVGFLPSAQGCPPFEVQFENKSLYGASYFWWFDDGNISTVQNPRHTFVEPGEYLVKLLVSGEGGLDSAYQTITVHHAPVADFKANPPVVQLPYESVKMINLSSIGSTYEWHFGDGNTSTEFEPEHLYEKAGIYDVTLIVRTDTEPACADQITHKNAVLASQPCKVIFPNAFTPNTSGPSGGHYVPNDPSNEVFYPVHTGMDDYRLEIYNRWGELIFRSTDVNIGWDGYHRGVLSPMGVYVWKVWVKCHNGSTIERAGDVTLYR